MTLGHRIEAMAARGALALLRALPPATASNLGGAVARTIGPWLPVSRVADRNLHLALPALDRAARRRIVRGVWDNLGRTAAEFPHVARLQPTPSGPGWEVEGEEHVRPLADAHGTAMMFTGHIGNWEVLPRVTSSYGVAFGTVYRAATNPLVDRIVLDLRQEIMGGKAVLFAKGASGARQMLTHLKAGGCIGLLQDQKMNEGVESRFFGHTAMTATALAAMALRLRCPVLPAYVRRIGPARFRVVYAGPLPLPDSGDKAADVAALTQTVNDVLEGWIRSWPEGWLWLHRRWPTAAYAGL